MPNTNTRGLTVEAIAAEFANGNDPVDTESANLHAAALKWIELGDGDPDDPNVYAEAVEAMMAARR